MSKMSDYLEDKLVDHVLRNTAYTPATKVYVGLYTSDPTDAKTGVEVSGGAYARQEAAFDASSGGATANSADVTFPVATASWGTVTHLGLLDASMAGNLLLHGELNTARTISTDNQLVFLAGEITVTFD
jgi:hypothetical protein